MQLPVFAYVFFSVSTLFLLIFLRPALGSTLVPPPVVFALLYISQLTIRFFVIVFAVFLVVLSLTVDIYGYQFLKENELSVQEVRCLGYLPPSVAHNDFIFSVLCDEAGRIGGGTVIVLYTLLLLNGPRVAEMARNRFGRLLAVGVFMIFLVHIFVNIGMTIGLMPITGLPLPFLSYGGSFMLTCCVLQGLIQSVYRYRKDFS